MVTQKMLKELLHYNQDTGVFTRLSRVAQCKAGDIANHVGSDGYVQIRVCGKKYSAHRLAWLYMTGEWPANYIDHINGVKTWNKWDNLRECTNQQNQYNVGISAHNTSGFKGVSWFKKTNKWRAQAQINGKCQHLGYFSTPEQASEVYQSFAKRNHGDFYKDI